MSTLASSGQFNITRQDSDGILILHFGGKLGYENVQDAKAVIDGLFEEARGYIYDFSGIDKIDSTGFGLVFSLISRKPAGTRAVLVVSDPFITDLFRITKIDKIVSMVATRDEAMRLF